MTPASPLETAFWHLLPWVLATITYVTALVAFVCLVLCWRLSRRNGYLLFALALGSPLVFSLAASASGRRLHRSASTSVSVIENNLRIDLPVYSTLCCWGAVLLYRDEKKKSRPRPAPTPPAA